MQIIPILDLSINETLSRTIMTSLTMIVALGSLLIWGPEVIFGFTAAMLLGIFVGTYSSVYMAAPILVRSEEHTSELQSLMRISYAVFCLKKKSTQTQSNTNAYTRQMS